MPFRLHTPDWVYEILPWLYFVAGVLAMLLIGNTMAVFGGLTLIATGCVVWLTRRHYRRAQTETPIHQWDAEANKASDLRFGALVWRSAYECGDAVIDMQHRDLFNLGNALIDALLEGNPRAEVEELLDNFVAHIVEHFNTEEVLMNQSEHPILESHLDVHHKLLDRANELNRKYHHGDRVVRDLVGFIANDVVAQHIILEDPKAIQVALGR